MVMWSKDDKYVIAGTTDHLIWVFDPHSGEALHVLNEHQKPIYVLDCHPNDHRLAMSAGYDGAVVVWNVEEGRCIKKWTIDQGVEGQEALDGCFSTDASHFAVSTAMGKIHLFGTGGPSWTNALQTRSLDEQGEHGQIVALQGDPEDTGHVHERIPRVGRHGLYRSIPEEQFFDNDQNPLVRDMNGFVADALHSLAPHLVPKRLTNYHGAPFDPPFPLPPTHTEPLTPAQMEAERTRLEAHIQLEKQLMLKRVAAPPSSADQEAGSISRAPPGRTSTRNAARARTGAASAASSSSGGSRRPWATRTRRSAPEAAALDVVMVEDNVEELDESRGSDNEDSEFESGDDLDPDGSFAAMYDSEEDWEGVPENALATEGVRRSSRRDRARRRQTRHSGDDDDDDVDDISNFVVDDEDSGSRTRSRGTRSRPARAPSSSSSSKSKSKSKAKERTERIPAAPRTPLVALPYWVMVNDPNSLAMNSYVPQMHDRVIYFHQGHLRYIEHFEPGSNDITPLETIPNLGPMAECIVKGIRYHRNRVTKITYCEVSLELVTPSVPLPSHLAMRMGHRTSSRLSSRSATAPSASTIRFDVNYHASELPDFLVLTSKVMSSLSREWLQGTRFKMHYQDVGWYCGIVKNVSASEVSFGTSGWECLDVVWDDASSEDRVSPWEVVPIGADDEEGPSSSPSNVCSLPDEVTASLSTRLGEICDSDVAVFFLDPIEGVVQKYPQYLNTCPCPIDLLIIKERLVNRYYRSVEALSFDYELLCNNAMAFNRPMSDVYQCAAELSHKLIDLVGPLTSESYRRQETSTDEDVDIEAQGDEESARSLRSKQKGKAKEVIIPPPTSASSSRMHTRRSGPPLPPIQITSPSSSSSTSSSSSSSSAPSEAPRLVLRLKRPTESIIPSMPPAPPPVARDRRPPTRFDQQGETVIEQRHRASRLLGKQQERYSALRQEIMDTQGVYTDMLAHITSLEESGIGRHSARRANKLSSEDRFDTYDEHAPDDPDVLMIVMKDMETASVKWKQEVVRMQGRLDEYTKLAPDKSLVPFLDQQQGKGKGKETRKGDTHTTTTISTTTANHNDLNNGRPTRLTRRSNSLVDEPPAPVPARPKRGRSAPVEEEEDEDTWEDEDEEDVLEDEDEDEEGYSSEEKKPSRNRKTPTRKTSSHRRTRVQSESEEEEEEVMKPTSRRSSTRSRPTHIAPVEELTSKRPTRMTSRALVPDHEEEVMDTPPPKRRLLRQASGPSLPPSPPASPSTDTRRSTRRTNSIMR
eukprot:TRINITY_DN8518_c0_g1_i2.p1 TRINITY_DN8518_c0_g1~~TRINITY_DN8518_c0_g1_i2.p1  ORF type:complete len:1266 (+),score=275.93 TRINITY_DN8518_c0_g1_i2:457-4254(+)